MSDKTTDNTPTKLTESEITASLEGLDTWSEVGGTIQRTYEFPDFIAAMAFVNKVADAAEQQQHHPDILVR
ncbi:MAG: 4a-hydroxytetrahydrobiopterin dehydratase, partial [Planctomycetota bacterium]